MFASFGSPAHSTLLHALRKSYLSTLSRFTSALFTQHNSRYGNGAGEGGDIAKGGEINTTLPTTIEVRCPAPSDSPQHTLISDSTPFNK